MPWDSASGVKLEPACGVFDSRVKRIPFSNFDRSPYGPSGLPSSLAGAVFGDSNPPPNAAPSCNTRLRFIGAPRGSFYAAGRPGVVLFRRRSWASHAPCFVIHVHVRCRRPEEDRRERAYFYRFVAACDLLTKNALASMRLPVCLVALGLFFWSWPNVAAAQTTTRDGVQALLRGDYQTAARILRPLAEDSPQPAPVAQFFMATLYAAGNAVARRDLKACGLYLSASTPANPLMNQALQLVRTFQEQSVRASVQLCTLIRADDYGQLPSASFDLGPDHRITIDRSGATISYRGTQGQAHWD